MKRVFALFCIFGVLLTALAACGRTEPAPTVPATDVPTQAAAYGYEIQTAVEETRGNIGFKFTRPVFSGTSPLVEAANRVYNQMEAEYKTKMEDEPGDENGPIAPWNYTELSGCTYDRGGVLSFTTDGDWFMGGVHNSWITGHTFDFNLGRALKIADFLEGDDAQITAALVDAFSRDAAGEDDLTDVEAQSGPDANFYLAGDGVHVFYMPYVVPATQNGVDVLIPWKSELIKQAYRAPEEATAAITQHDID